MGVSDSRMNPVIISPTARHTATVIFFHGLGDTGHGWASSMSAIKQPFVKYICPTAPVNSVSLNNGFRMNSWFDIFSLEAGGPEDEDGIKRASQTVHSLIESEIRSGIPSNRILIGGFSQGGALALYSALNYSKPLAGVLALSCWLPLFKQFPEKMIGNGSTPVLQCHGDADPLIPHKWGLMTSEVLKNFMSNVSFKTYPGLAHSSNDREMIDAKAFIDSCFSS